MSDVGHLDEGFLQRYRQLLDDEGVAFDELEHAYEDGDRLQFERDLALWRNQVERRNAFLDRHGLQPITMG